MTSIPKQEINQHAPHGPPQMADFKSEWWPASNRCGGRLRARISGRLRWNTQAATRHFKDRLTHTQKQPSSLTQFKRSAARMDRELMVRILGILAITLALMSPAAVEARRPDHAYQQTNSYDGGGYYTARSGHQVRRPVKASRSPRGASAQCRDDSWSFSESHRGTCSHHGGVSRWL